MEILRKHGAKCAALVGAAVALIVPATSFAAFSDGIVIPVGTTNTFATAIYTYVWVPLTATVFQAEAIQILVSFALVAIVMGIVFMLLRGFRLHH